MRAKIVTLIVFIFSFMICNGQANSTDTLSKHAGQIITLCGIIKDVQSSEKAGGNSSVVTFQADGSSVINTALINNKLNKSMDYKLESLKGQNICFAGKVKVNKGVAEIMVTRIEDIYKAPVNKR